MKLFKCNNKNYMFPDKWDDVDLGTYFKLAKLDEMKADFGFTELYLLKLIEALAKDENGNSIEEGELDDLDLGQVDELSKSVMFIQNLPEFSKEKTFEIDEVLYSSPDDFKKLSIGEFVSIKTYQDNNASVWDAAPWIIAILWRPSEWVWDEERKENVIKREPFKVENLEWRKNLLLKQPAIKLISTLLFFSIMKPTFNENTEDYLKNEQKEMTEIGDLAITS